MSSIFKVGTRRRPKKRRFRSIDNQSRIVEIASRTLLGRYLLRPSAQINDVILGVLGRAQAKYGVEIYAFVFMSNHFHMLIRAESVETMSRFVGYLKTHIALEVHRALGTSGPFWGPRFSHSSVGDTSADVVRRLRYLLRNGCKENLVGSPLDWPGVSSARALCDGETELHGTWFNRTKEDKEWRKHGERGKRKRFPSVERVTLSPLPFLADSSPSERRHYIRALVQEIENETRARHRRDGTTPMGVVEVLRQDPLASPKDFQPTHPLRFLTSSRRELTKMRYAREQKEIAYSIAAEKLDRGENDFHFPEDCFPPGLPFVPRHAAAQPP